MFFLVLLYPILTSCQEDPCTPNPCGDNTRCASSYNGPNPVISCECLIGYRVPEGGDPFDGCIKQLVPGGTSRGGGSPASPPLSRPSSTTESTIAPLSTIGSVARESVPRALENGDNANRLQAGQRPGQLLPRRKTKPSIDIKEVDTKELFPEGNRDYREVE